MVRLHGRWYTLIHLLYAHGLQPEAQVVRLRQVVRPRLLNDWTESLMQFGYQPGWWLLHDGTVLAGPGGNEAIN